MKKQLCAAVAVAFSALPVFAVVYEFRDRYKDVSYLDVSYWQQYLEAGNTPPATTLPSTGDSVYITSGSSKNIKVFVDGSVSEEYAQLVIKPHASSSLRFFGKSGYTFKMPYSEGKKYLSPAFIIQNGEYEGCFFTSGNTTTNAVLSWTDADFTVAADAEKKISICFQSGAYDFAPDGMAGSALSLELKKATSAVFYPMTILRTPKMLVAEDSYMCISGAVETIGKMTVNSARLELHGVAQKTIGEASIENGGVLLVDNGAKLVQLSGTMTVDETVDSLLVVSNGIYDASNANMNIGSSYDGRVIVDGGELIVKGGDGIQIGNYGGNGSLILNSGSVKVSRVRIARSTAAASKKALFVQKGGTFEATGDGGFQFQQSCTDNNKGTHEIRLEGGVCKLTRIFRDATVLAGEAILSGNGGTLVARKSHDDFISNITRAEFGAKGLTLDSNGFDIKISVPAVDKTGEEGVLSKIGDGTLSFDGSTWSVSETRISGGTVKFLKDYDTGTQMFIAKGSVLSLVGSAKTLSVDSLSISDGVLELDSGDVITVNGNLEGERLCIRWASLPTSVEPFLVVKGEISESMKKMLLHMACENSIAPGKVGKCTLVTDDEGKTTVSFELAEKKPHTGEVRWTGSGSWAELSNWDGGKMPTVGECALFDGTSSGCEVALNGETMVGALRFTAGNYLLAGEKAFGLACDVSDGVSVEGGLHTIATPLELGGSTGFDISTGASLTLVSSVSFGGIVKSGGGALVLEGLIASSLGVEMQAGTLEVKSESALGTISSDKLIARSGTLVFNHPEGKEMVIDVPIEQEGQNSKTTVVYRADTPVTIKNFSNKTGFIVKSGAATMTIDVPSRKEITFLPDNLQGGTASTQLGFLQDGTVSFTAGQPVRIAEGELRFTGGDGSVVVNKGSFRVGVPLSVRPEKYTPAMLTVDGVEFYGSGGECFYPGFNMDPNLHNPTSIIRVINGGLLKVKVVQPGYNSTKDKTCCIFALTNGTYRSTVASTYISRGRLDSTPSRYTIVRYLMNNAKVEFSEGSALMDGSITLDADNGSFWGAGSGKPMELKWNNANRIYGTMHFRSGSTFACKKISEVVGQNRLLEIVFEDAKWHYDAENGDKVWPAPLTEFIRYEMRGRGVVLSPAAGKTFSTLAKFEGEGGVVNAGKGTIAFKSGTCAFEGVLDVVEEEGAANLSEAGAVEALQVAGAGAIVGANVGKLTVKAIVDTDWTPKAKIPVLKDCTINRLCIDVGRTEDSPAAEPVRVEAFPVARIAGSTEINLATCRLVGSGRKNVGGEFTLVGDTLYVKPEYKGLMLIVK